MGSLDASIPKGSRSLSLSVTTTMDMEEIAMEERSRSPDSSRDGDNDAADDLEGLKLLLGDIVVKSIYMQTSRAIIQVGD